MPPDFGSPVAGPQTAFNPNQGLTTLSNLYGLTQQQQGLQLQRQALQVGGAQVQQAQREQDARGFLTGMMQSGRDDLGQNIRDPVTGEMDPVKVSQAIGRKLPADLAQPVLQSMLVTQNNKIGVMEASRALSQKENEDIAGIVQSVGVGADPQVAMKRMDQYASINPDPNARILVNNAKPFIQMIANTDDPKEKIRLAGRLTAMLGTGQAVQTQPGQVNIPTGGNVLSGTTAPPVAAGGGGFTQTTKTPMTPAPAGAQYIYDPISQTYNLAPGGGGGTGGAVAPYAPPRVPGPNAPPTQRPATTGNEPAGAPGLPHYAPGEGKIIEANTVNMAQNRKLAQDAQVQSDILGRIEALAASPGMYTGPGAGNVGELATALARIPGFEKAADYANNFNELTKFMAQNAARMGQQMGLEGSDARLDLAIHSQPNQAMDVRTIQNVSEYMRGLVHMQLAKADAMDNWLAEKGNSPRNEQQFEKLWRDNADPRLFQMAQMGNQQSASAYAALHIKPNEKDTLAQKHAKLVELGAL